jgi:hypothetical protein
MAAFGLEKAQETRIFISIAVRDLNLAKISLPLFNKICK